MTEIDYEKLGLKCGLEIHQQLDTHKLFCNCPSILRNDEPEFSVERRLHAVAGEEGEIDIAAKHEVEKNRKFIYQGYSDNVCLVELDEEPPHEINKEDLRIVLQISLLLHAHILPLSQIMRKTVIDGSNTSGFQRTVLIARDGYIETSQGRVGIDTICLEEDSARIISKKQSVSVYRLDRLGIPLIEIATSPDIKSPEQAKETALYLGDVLRSCKVKRGIGTIRQDVNVSIEGGARVEIKGFQNPAMMVKTIALEVERQKKLIDHGKKVKKEVRNALVDGTTKFLRPMPGAARMYPETDLPLLEISRNLINDVKKTLPRLRKDIKKDFEKIGLNKEMINLLFKQNKLNEFKDFLKVLNNPNLIAKVLLIFPKEIAKHKNLKVEQVEKKLDSFIFPILNLVKNKKLASEQVKPVLIQLIEGKKLEDILKNKENKLNLEEEVLKIIKQKPGLSEKAYMGLIMKGFKGQINGKEAMEIIHNFLSNK